VVVQALPLDCAICDEVYHSLIVEHVTSCCKSFSTFVAADTFDESREEKDHVAPFIHDGCAAIGTRDLAGEVMRDIFVGWIIPTEIVVAMCEVDVRLLEDGCPLEGCPMQSLACGAVTEFGGQRFLSAQLILDFSAVTLGFPHCFEV